MCLCGSRLDSFARLSRLHATNPDYLRRCAVCILKGLCEQCPAKSWAEHGTFDTPVEYLCEVAHAQARYLGWLDENKQGWEVVSLDCFCNPEVQPGHFNFLTVNLLEKKHFLCYFIYRMLIIYDFVL